VPARPPFSAHFSLSSNYSHVTRSEEKARKPGDFSEDSKFVDIGDLLSRPFFPATRPAIPR